MAPRIHAFIISWRGQVENAARIEAALAGEVDRLTVIHSDDTPDQPLGERWVRVPDAWFYGRKFRHSLELFDGDVMLQIVADVSCDDWAGLARRCGDAFAHFADVGLWAPEVDGTWFGLHRIQIARLGETPLHCVTLVDAIVWALSADVLRRLVGLDYDANNLGWGIERLAALHCHASGRLVVLDQAVQVIHPPGRGYSESEAVAQSQAFLLQATLAEQLQGFLIDGYMDWRTNPPAKPEPR